MTVGPAIDYAVVKTTNRYTNEEGMVVLAEALLGKQFGGKKDPDHEVLAVVKGSDLVGLRYDALLDWAQPMEDPGSAFQVIPGDFVTTEDGTGIVHTSPTIGADDARVAKDAGVPAMLVDDGHGHGVPLVDLQGRFRVGPFAGRQSKAEFGKVPQTPNPSTSKSPSQPKSVARRSVEVRAQLSACGARTNPFVLPLDSWFIRATEAKPRMQELNDTITEAGEHRHGPLWRGSKT